MSKFLNFTKKPLIDLVFFGFVMFLFYFNKKSLEVGKVPNFKPQIDNLNFDQTMRG